MAQLDLKLTLTDGRSYTLSQQFDFVEPPPPPPELVIAGVAPNTGKAGDSVTLSVTGLNGVPVQEVLFGTKSAQVVSVTASTITVLVPAQ